MKKITIKTGAVTPVSGQYRPVGRTTEITLSKGNRVPRGKSPVHTRGGFLSYKAIVSCQVIY